MAQVIFHGDKNAVEGNKVYELAVKINNGEQLTNDEKVFLYREANSPILVPCGCIMRMGVTMDFRQVMKRYFVESDYGIVALWAFDNTTFIYHTLNEYCFNIFKQPNCINIF